MNPERTGEFVGTALRPVKKVLEAVVGGFETKSFGTDNLEGLDSNQSAIIAANHIGPVEKRGEFLATSGLTPDVVILPKIVNEITKRKAIAALVYYQDEDKLTLDVKDKDREATLKTLRQGFIQGFGGIPVDISEKQPTFNRPFFKGVESAVAKKDLLVIFSEGTWRKRYHDYSKEMQIKGGTAHMAKKYSLKIVPTYIYCGEDFIKDRKVRVNFGKPIDPSGKTKEEVSKELATAIAELQKDLKRKDTSIQYPF